MADRDIPCIDQVTGHAHFCRRLVTRPDLAPSVVLLSEQRAGILTEPPLPPLTAQARNFAAATVRDMQHQGERFAEDDPAYLARLAVCQLGAGLEPDQIQDGHCDRYRPSDGRCGACGCVLAGVVLSKARRPHELCDLGRWPGD